MKKMLVLLTLISGIFSQDYEMPGLGLYNRWCYGNYRWRIS